MDAADGQHSWLQWRRLTRDERLKGEDQLSTRQHWIWRLVGHGRVSAGAGECDAERVRGGEDRPRTNVDLANLHLVPQVEAETGVRHGLKDAVTNHAFCAAHLFLRRLESKYDRAGQVAATRGQQFSHA